MSEALHYSTIVEIAPLIRSRRLSPVELTRSVLDRIDRLDSGLHSYATVLGEQALAAAERAAAEIASGSYRGPLHGVPVAVKDLCFTRGVRTMGGTQVLADHVPEFDATVVTRLSAAGAVLLGKLNLTEGAMGGYHPAFPVPCNPWDAGRWAGASSSGSAVATAAGLCYASLGSDTGGSIRFPAACNGTVGLKPTWGRVSRYGVLALAESLDHVGPLTRSSADAGIMLQAIAGPDPNDPTALPAPVPDMLERPDRSIERIEGVRIGFDERYAVRDVEAQVAAAVVAAVEMLEGLGAHIVEVRLPDIDEFDEYVAAWAVLCTAEAVAAHGGTYPSRRDEYGPWFRGWLDLGAQVSGADYARANNARAACTGHLRRAFEQIDVLACPAMPDLPFPVTPEGQRSSSPVVDETSYRLQRFTVPFDCNGAPTLTLPCGKSSEGLPLSLQLAGKPLGEPLLCRLGAAYEAATEWHNLHPDL